MTSADLGIYEGPPRFGLRALAKVMIPDIGITPAGHETNVGDSETAMHLIAFGLCEPVAWEPDRSEIRRRALDALQLLTGGDPESADRKSDATKEQLARIVALTQED